jgi:outer membrane protein TolC
MAAALWLLGGAPSASGAQGAPWPADTLQLAQLQAEALAHDPRADQRTVLAQGAALRQAEIRRQWRPQLSLGGTLSHQSDVTFLPLRLPGTSVPVPPRDRWQAVADVQQLLYDGGAARRRMAVEGARLAEGDAGVTAALHPLRDEVTRAFFDAALLASRDAELSALAGDLAQLLEDTRVRVREGAALPRDSAQVRAAWRRATGAVEEARSGRAAALAVLGQLTGRILAPDQPLALPDGSSRLAALRRTPAEALRERPEYARFARARARLREEGALASVENRPRVVAFAQGGMGRPGLNQFQVTPDEFWQAGVRVEWRPYTWGSASRTREQLALQARLLDTEERALAGALSRAVAGALAEVDRLRRQLEEDVEVIALREEVLRAAEVQHREAMITAAELVELRTDLLEARLTRERHRIDLARAEARILDTLGARP